jgi:dynein light intermediate chain
MQTTDELIRQVTINCAERGLLLLRVRDELRMAIASYQTLYESSIAFGMRKALAAEQQKLDLEAKVCAFPSLNLLCRTHTNRFICCCVDRKKRWRRTRPISKSR